MDVFTGRFAIRTKGRTYAVAIPIYKKPNGTIYLEESMQYPINPYNEIKDITFLVLDRMRKDNLKEKKAC